VKSLLVRFSLKLLRLVVIGYATAILVVAGCQRSLIYYPQKLGEPAAVARAKQEGLEPWRNAAGEIIGWRLPNAKAKNRMVVFHGNAGCALDRPYYVESFQALNGGADWEVFLFEYPGYGARPGALGKSSFVATGRAALDELLAADARPLFILGESLGSGTACALAGALPEQVRGLLLVVPFARLQDVAQEKFPFLPCGLILRDKFDNVTALASYHRPVAVVVAENDEVVTAAQGRKLHAAYQGPKTLLTLPGATHNAFAIDAGAGWVRESSAFLLKR
jgi:pimeloyl-ACP methyl ester carboxylesterase